MGSVCSNTMETTSNWALLRVLCLLVFVVTVVCLKAELPRLDVAQVPDVAVQSKDPLTPVSSDSEKLREQRDISHALEVPNYNSKSEISRIKRESDLKEQKNNQSKNTDKRKPNGKFKSERKIYKGSKNDAKLNKKGKKRNKPRKNRKNEAVKKSSGNNKKGITRGSEIKDGKGKSKEKKNKTRGIKNEKSMRGRKR